LLRSIRENLNRLCVDLQGKRFVSWQDEGPTSGDPVLLVDGPISARLLPFVLSVIAGASDVIGFLGLGGLFTAHITGNLVILAAHVVSGESAPLAQMLSVPIFMIVLILTRLFAEGVEAMGFDSLHPLLLLHLLLLAGFLTLCVAAGPHLDPNAAIAIVAAMLGVSAMAVQNALLPISLKGLPATAVMTTNVTRLTVDVSTMLLARDLNEVAKARRRARLTWPAVVGFVAGCGVGACFEMVVGLLSLALPVGLALLALALGLASRRGAARRPVLRLSSPS
jgi:uncharacterized membrane protein YoaK (UPF0700 family)